MFLYKFKNKTCQQDILISILLKTLNLILLIATCFSLQAREVEDSKTEDEQKPPKLGNFALTTSQQPAALFGFGGNVIDKGEVQLYFFADEFVGKDRFLLELIPSVLFGVTDEFSIYYSFPVTPKSMDRKHVSAGLEDFSMVMEYAFYDNSTTVFSDAATVVAGLGAPTGSIIKNPSTGFGSPSFFVGGTYYRTTVEWVFFTAQGAFLTLSNHRGKPGDAFLYQFGLGKNIKSPKNWIYAWMVELDGQYTNKNRVKGKNDSNSGGNVIYLTPSLWISSKEMLAQFGISLPVHQHLFGNQRNFDFALNFNFAWSFY